MIMFVPYMRISYSTLDQARSTFRTFCWYPQINVETIHLLVDVMMLAKPLLWSAVPEEKIFI